MLKTNVPWISNEIANAFLDAVAKRISAAAADIRSISLFSEDALYKRCFTREVLPALYREHIQEGRANCVFCTHLIKSFCHRQCFKCSLEKYTDCSPLFPGRIQCEAIYPYQEDKLRIPWYYTETCDCFERLPQENYSRNLNVVFGASTIYHFEILESLEKGLLSGEKPCHICASTDYGIYRRCSGQGDFQAFSPCRRIVTELAEYYRNPDPEEQVSTEAS